MKHSPFLIRKNSSNLIAELEVMKFIHSDLCNEGIYILVENGIIMEINHLPYKQFMDFGENESAFLEYAKALSLSF